MFGIGLPELILIMGVALIVVGPEKLPDLAKSLARQFVELKKTANALKQSIQEETSGKPWEEEDPAEYTPPGVLMPPSEDSEGLSREEIVAPVSSVDLTDKEEVDDPVDGEEATSDGQQEKAGE